jgi:hypothetical protein
VIVTYKDLTAEDLRATQRLASSDSAAENNRSGTIAGRDPRTGGCAKRTLQIGGRMSKIVLIEDNEVQRDVLSRRLHARGYD